MSTVERLVWFLAALRILLLLLGSVLLLAGVFRVVAVFPPGDMPADGQMAMQVGWVLLLLYGGLTAATIVVRSITRGRSAIHNPPPAPSLPGEPPRNAI